MLCLVIVGEDIPTKLPMASPWTSAIVRVEWKHADHIIATPTAQCRCKFKCWKFGFPESLIGLFRILLLAIRKHSYVGTFS